MLFIFHFLLSEKLKMLVFLKELKKLHINLNKFHVKSSNGFRKLSFIFYTTSNKLHLEDH